MSDAKDKITHAELKEMFGDVIPMEAITLLWEGPAEMTIGEYRAKLREIAGRAYIPPEIVAAAAQVERYMRMHNVVELHGLALALPRRR